MSEAGQGVCGGDHRVALVAARGEVSRYWKPTGVLTATFGAGLGLTAPVLLLHRRLAPAATPDGGLGLTWRSGVQPIAATQQQALDLMGGLLLGVTVATLGVAAVTLLALSLAGERERVPEVVVRRAVGAGRRMLLLTAAAEAALIVMTGLGVAGALAVGVTTWWPPWPGSLHEGSIRMAAAALSALAAIVFAGILFPIVLPRRRTGAAEPGPPAPLAPAALQVGMTLVVLTMGSLLARHAGGLLPQGRGSAADARVLAVDQSGHAAERRAASYSALLLQHERVGTGPVSLTSPGALVGLGPVSVVTTDCGRCSEGGLPLRWRVKAATHHLVSADTFEMMGMRVVEGRGITGEDAWSAPRVAVVNRNLAAREFQDGRAIGRRIRVLDDGAEWSTVVGVVDDPAAGVLGASLLPHYAVYLSVLQRPPSHAELMMRADAASGRGVSVAELRVAQAAPLAWLAARFTEQGWAMLAIAALGSLAVARLWVTSLLVELGVRRALGARRRRIVLFVLARAAAVCAAGIAAGVWLGVTVWSILAGLVTGLDPWDTATVVQFGALLVASTLLGALPPAWRAARATPASLLAAR